MNEDDERVEWPEPAQEPDEEPAEPWAKENTRDGAEAEADPEPELQQ